MKAYEKKYQAGFTLLEYIVGLVIAAIAAAMLYSFFGSALKDSVAPIVRLKNVVNLSGVMENIVTDFNRLNALNLRYKWQSGVTYRIGSVVVPTKGYNNGYYYKCTKAGTSGTSEPTWNTPGGATVTGDGSVEWQAGGVIVNATGTDEMIVWQPSHSYSTGNIMIPVLNNGHYYVCTQGGTSGSSVPETWESEKYYYVDDIVVASLFNGHNYRCTASGRSGTSEPVWPTTDGGEVTDNTVTWQEVTDGTVRWAEAGTILERSATGSANTILDDNILNYLMTNPGRYDNNTNSYTYVVSETKFIKFSGGSETDATGMDEKNILRVTIKSIDSNEKLTQLFTIR